MHRKQENALDGKFFYLYFWAIATQEVAVKAQEEVKYWVKNSGLKLGWVASQIPCSQPTLSRWLHGKAMPGAVYRHRLADMTNIDSIREEESWK